MRTKQALCAVCEDEPVKCSGMCSPCYQWWRRIQLYSASELVTYLRRLTRAGARGVYARRRMLHGRLRAA